MTIPSFRDWAVIFYKAYRWRGNKLADYILLRIERKEKAMREQIRLTMPTFHTPYIVEFSNPEKVRLSDDGFPYPRKEEV